MKLSVSLPDDDVAFLDEFARVTGLPSRSAALRHAVRQLRLPGLERDYEAAWAEWENSADHHAWETAGTDGLADAPR